MNQYPPIKLKTPDAIVNILQLTDLHLCRDKNVSVEGCNVYDSFIACLSQALAEDIRCDLIMLTGDLINELDNSIYERIFAILNDTGIAFICLSGNHDVTEEANGNYSSDSDQSTFPTYPTFNSTAPDPRLISQHIIQTQDWQITLLDSSQPGHVDGVLAPDSLDWLSSVLKGSPNTPTLIALHHHVMPVNSRWLDEYILADYELFWQTIKPYPQVKAVINGHVHQEFYCLKNGVACYMTPSTCYQFKPLEDNFTYDSNAKSGYRWLQLNTDATIDSWVERLKC